MNFQTPYISPVNSELISPSPTSHATISEHKDHTHPTYEQATRAHITDTNVQYYIAVTSYDATTQG
jgi:hypothetical protein